MVNSMIEIFHSRSDAILVASWEHLQLTFISLFLATFIAIPLGILLTRYKKWSEPIIGITAIFQTVPSLALLGFMIPLLGIGTTPAIVALTIYGLLPILRNTYTGIIFYKHLIHAGFLALVQLLCHRNEFVANTRLHILD